MKRKNNYIPCDDIQGQQSLTGLENTVRIERTQLIKPKPVKKASNKLSYRELQRLEKQYKYEMYRFNRECEELLKCVKPVESLSHQDIDYDFFHKTISRYLKEIKGE